MKDLIKAMQEDVREVFKQLPVEIQDEYEYEIINLHTCDEIDLEELLEFFTNKLYQA